MLCIDGSFGEGGGQILRTSLTLSMMTGTPIRVTKIRAGRGKPGLLRQHLACVRAAVEISGAKAHGMDLGSMTLEFHPGPVVPGDYQFAVGSAGSAMLVLQTILLPLAHCTEPSRVMLEGGTHNPAAPPFPFVHDTWLPLMGRMGYRVDATLHRHGFYPAGGGQVEVAIQPKTSGQTLHLRERGAIRSREVVAILSNLHAGIGLREIKAVYTALGWPSDSGRVEELRSGRGPGNALVVRVECDHLTEVFTGFGEHRISAEAVGEQVADEARAWLDSGVPVGSHLADQLLIPMALAGSGEFRTLPLTEHTRTNIALIERFLPVRFIVEADGPAFHIRVEPTNEAASAN
ncbi:RNA 3'-terminal phosphate cyclase [bacterium]|nr:RNA 3'-terminal phosphate cyclase [bacterium]